MMRLQGLAYESWGLFHYLLFLIPAILLTRTLIMDGLPPYHRKGLLWYGSSSKGGLVMPLANVRGLLLCRDVSGRFAPLRSAFILN